MNNNLIAIVFLVLSYSATFAAGVGWHSRRSREPWEEGFQRGFTKATKEMFKVAVRAQVSKADNSGSSRFLLSRGRAAVRALRPEDETTVADDDTTVVIAFRQRDDKQAAA